MPSIPRAKQSKTPTRQRIQPRPTPIEGDAFYRAEALAARWGTHPMTVWQWAARGKIPKPVKLGPNVTRWRGSDILKHEQSGRADG